MKFTITKYGGWALRYRLSQHCPGYEREKHIGWYWTKAGAERAANRRIKAATVVDKWEIGK